MATGGFGVVPRSLAGSADQVIPSEAEQSLALALAAGGARGAYQAGALVKLAESNLRFGAVSGTSIGTLNGAFYAQGDGSSDHLAKLVNFWERLPDVGLLHQSPDLVLGAAEAVVRWDPEPLACLLRDLAKGNVSIFDPRPVAKLLDQLIDYEAICTGSKVRLFISLLPGTDPITDVILGGYRTPRYVDASTLKPDELKAVLLAATAIPFAFPAGEIAGQRVSDAALADCLPSSVLYREGARGVVSIFLADDTIEDRGRYPDATFLQIRPSVNIDRGFGSVLDFSAEHIGRLIELGRNDAQRYCSLAKGVYDAIQEMRNSGNANSALLSEVTNWRHGQ